MKRKILSLVFAAAMLLGTATMTSADNNWDCFTISVSCGGGAGFSAYVCGDTQEEQLEMIGLYLDMYC